MLKMKQPTFYLDLSLCTGCRTCMIACKDRWDLKKGVNWRRVTEYAGGDWKKDGNTYLQSVFAYFLSISCNHCEKPICVEKCPTTAMHKRDDGVVLIDPDKCIGCRYCEWACPYGAPQYDEELGKMTKCNFCVDYLEKGGSPACVASCPNRALHYGELEDLKKRFGGTSDIAPLPDPVLTLPNLLLVPQKDARPWDSDDGRISNPEEG